MSAVSFAGIVGTLTLGTAISTRAVARVTHVPRDFLIVAGVGAAFTTAGIIGSTVDPGSVGWPVIGTLGVLTTLVSIPGQFITNANRLFEVKLQVGATGAVVRSRF